MLELLAELLDQANRTERVKTIQSMLKQFGGTYTAKQRREARRLVRRVDGVQ